MPDVTVAIPVRDGGELFASVLRALARQTLAHELLVCDSGSRDGSVSLAREHGARVLEIDAGAFTHGGTRNRLLAARPGRARRAAHAGRGARRRALAAALLDGFALAEDVAIVYGPYRPRAGASPAVRAELEGWFGSLSPDGAPTVERLDERERRSLPAVELIGRRGFFTDANACIARAAWERVPFRDVPYAEDRVLAIDMLRAGYAKAFVPRAAVVHSHDYTPSQQLRRSFDEWRGLREVYGWREPAAPRHLLSRLRGALGAARRELAARQKSPPARAARARGASPGDSSRACRAPCSARAPSGSRRRCAAASRWSAARASRRSSSTARARAAAAARAGARP